MKKIMVILLLLAVGVIGNQLQAETISHENISVTSIRNVLSEKYGTKVDENGDLIISTSNGRVFLEVIQLEKGKMIQLDTSFRKYDKATTQELIILANKWNDSKRFLRVSVDPKDGSSTCDYYLIFAKGVDRENLLATIDWFIDLKDSWMKFVVNGGKQSE